MMKRKKRILIGGSIVLIAAICGAIFLFSGKTQPTKSLAKQVEEDYTGIEEIINQAVEKNENLAMSSNPYEYVKNNSYYDRLVSKGISILPILEKRLMKISTEMDCWDILQQLQLKILQSVI